MLSNILAHEGSMCVRCISKYKYTQGTAQKCLQRVCVTKRNFKKPALILFTLTSETAKIN